MSTPRFVPLVSIIGIFMALLASSWSGVFPPNGTRSALAQGTTRVAYIYDADAASRDAFKQLLNDRGITVDLLTLAEAETFDFSVDQAIIIGDDTGTFGTWNGSTAAVNAINKAGKPVVGIGLGGTDFFQATGLFINYGQSWFSSGTGTYVVNDASSFWSTPNPVAASTGNIVPLYSSPTNLLAVYNPSPVSGVIRVGRETNDTTHYPLIAQSLRERCYFLWGFRSSAKTMTTAGQDLFINSLSGETCGTPNKINQIAYVYNTDTVAASSFRSLLQNAGWSVTVFPLSQLSGVDLSGFYAIILGHDTGSYETWGSPAAVDSVRTARRPVIGIEQGGYSFFGKLGLNIGYNRGATGGTIRTIKPVDPARPVWNTPFSIPTDPTTGKAIIYTAEQTVTAIHTSQTDATNERIGVDGLQNEFNFVIGEKNCYMLWGYAGAPSAMTAEGQNLFLNLVAHVGPWARCPSDLPSTTPTATATPLPTATSTPVPTATPLPSTDLIADRLEVTQAVQDLNNSVRLVRNKRTFVRFHTRSTSGNQLTYALLRVQRGSSVTYLSPINPGSQILVRPAPDRATRDHAFLFELPNGYKEGTVSLSAEVNPVTWWRSRSPLETNYGNNSASTSVSFENVPTVNVVLYRVGYQTGGTTYYPPASDATQMASWIRRTFPLSNLRVWNRSYYHGNSVPNCDQVNANLFGKKIWDILFFWTNDVPGGARYYGMVDDRGSFMRGCAIAIPGVVASGPTGTGTWGWDSDGSYGDWYGGHELAHDWGRGHANYCGAGGGPGYPYPGGRISPTLTGNTALYGFDIGTRAIYGPNWNDVMTYCANQWISDFTYEGLMSFYQSNPVRPDTLQRQLAAQAERLLVTGMINPFSNTVELQPLYVIPNAGDIEPRVPGNYSIVLRNSTGAELARYPFTPDLVEGGSLQQTLATTREVELLAITELVPFVAGTAQVDIEGPGNALLKRISAGTGQPSVAITAPNGGETLGGPTVTVTWSASDPDGDPLRFNVQYSPDNGASWEMLAQNISGNSITLDSSNIVAGPQSLFRVWVTDGINTASDQSNGSFTVPNHVPSVEIIEPASTLTVVTSQTLTLQGNAYDVDTGSMQADQLQWSSSIDGVLGNGDVLSVTELSVGTHIITLRADDGAGGVATDTVEVVVVSNPTQAPVANALTAGPTLIMFEPANGMTSATVSVDNQNAAQSIAWNASANQPWVVLSATSGTTPGTLTVSFNNTGLSAGTHFATITLTSPNNPGTTTTINVQVVIPAMPRIYLPLILR